MIQQLQANVVILSKVEATQTNKQKELVESNANGRGRVTSDPALL
jgi:hypothetical protein